MFNTVTIVGVGLMGGSLGLALKERGLAKRVIGLGRSADRLNLACEFGQIDEIEIDSSAAAAKSDLMVVATPVELVAATIVGLRSHCTSDCLLTDLGSTKAKLISAIESAGGMGHFVGCHPLAGDHRSGCEFARGDLFKDRVVVVTPTANSEAGAVKRLAQMWQLIGARVIELTPAEHDRLVAAASHMPHLAAAAVAGATPREALSLAASGWLDTTRVASGHVEMWRQIIATNRSAILASTDVLIEKLTAMRTAIANEDDEALTALLTEGKQTRDVVGN